MRFIDVDDLRQESEEERGWRGMKGEGEMAREVDLRSGNTAEIINTVVS